MWNDRFANPCSVAGRGVAFDPGTLAAGSLILSGVGAAVSAAGTIAGGQNANALGQMQQTADNYQAAQITENASSEVGAAQRTMLDTQQKTRMAGSTLTADAAGSGFVASSGSPAAIAGSIAKRGNYEAAMNLFQGENAETGDLNKAAGITYSGDIAAAGGAMQETASDYAAVGNLASAGGTMFKNYASMTNPKYG